jgi:hypothetical protein
LLNRWPASFVSAISIVPRRYEFVAALFSFDKAEKRSSSHGGIASGGTQLNGWRSADIHQAILASFGLSADRYTLTQLRYDLRKLKAHGLLERNGKRYLYRLTDKGTKAALMFVLFHTRVCGPLSNSLFHHRPDES